MQKQSSTDFRCFLFQISDGNGGMGADRQGGQVTSLDLPNAHFLPYMDNKEVCHAQPSPSD